MLGDLDLCFRLSWEPRLSRGRSRLLSLGRRGLQALSRLLGGEHPLPCDLEPDRLFFLRLSRCSCEELPGLPECDRDRDRDLRRPRPRESLFLSLLLSLAFFLLARSRLLERSLEDLGSLALAPCLLAWSSPTRGDTDLELLSPEWEPERGRERALRCSWVEACFFLPGSLPRELDVERERERDEDCSSTILWVVVSGASGSATVTQVTRRSSEPKKVLWGGWSSSSQGSRGDGLRARGAESGPPAGSSSPSPSAGPSPRSFSTLAEGPREGSASVPKTVSTV